MALKKYLVESRKDNTELFDNYINDYIDSDSIVHAVAEYKMILLDMGVPQDELDLYEYRVREL